MTLLSQNPSRDAKKDISNVTDFGNLFKPVWPLAEDKLTWYAVLGPIPQGKLSSAVYHTEQRNFHNGEQRVVLKYFN